MKKATAAIALLLPMLLAGCGGESEDEPGDSRSVADEPTLDAAVEECALDAETDGAEAIDLRSDGSSLTLNADTAGIPGQLLAVVTVNCIVDELDGPSSIPDRVAAATALAGPQSEDWDGFEATWSFSGSSNRLLFTVDES